MKLPNGRTELYTIFRCCERLGIRPPDVKPDWDENTPVMQGMLLTYEDIRHQEDYEAAGGE